MMGSVVEMPPDDGMVNGVSNLDLGAPWTEAETTSNNSNILYIAVEYVKDSDFKMEPEALSPGTEEFADYDQHISPLDASMSAISHFSPVYTSESSSAFDNPVVVTQALQNDGHPQDESLSSTDISSEPLNPEHFMHTDTNGMIDHSSMDNLQIVPDSDQEGDILITDQNTGISYLVERCLADDSHLLDPDSLLDSDLLALDENALKSHLSEIVVEPVSSMDSMKLESEDFNFNLKSLERRSQRLCCNTARETEEQLLSCVQQIYDKPVLSRAKASLPESYLQIVNNQFGGCGVFAKKFIPKRTQFGPLEGVLLNENQLKREIDQIHLSIESGGKLMTLDVSDENTSNWMCFVQLANTFTEQNLVVVQNGDNLYYTTTKNILPKQELLVGYSTSYAQRRNLRILEPELDENDLWACYECPQKFLTSEDFQKHLDEHDELLTDQQCAVKKKKKPRIAQLAIDESLQCITCMQVFSAKKVPLLKQHMIEHGFCAEDSTQDRFNVVQSFNCNECESVFLKEEELDAHNQKNHGEQKATESGKEVDPQNKYKCLVCYKIFASGERIQKHMLVHGAEESKPLQCDKCNKRFLNNSALTCHLKTHLLGRKVFECPICKESFHHVLQLKLHVPKHCIGGHYTCPHCNKRFDKYSIVRKHIRGFHCERKHTCPNCSKPFPTLDKLRMHLLKHSDHREFLCSDCGKQFKRKDKLKEHCKRMHSEERENAVPGGEKGSPSGSKKFTPKVQPTDYHRFIYKCHTCLVGFKRRGMLVNHLAKRHPDISPESVPELNLPILRATKDYYCNYCDKVYKSSSKRKAHILKNHPGATLPLSNRRLDASKTADLPNPTFSQTVGSVTTHPQACQWCHKQYASKAKLLQHQRKKHVDMLEQKPEDNGGKSEAEGEGIKEYIQSGDGRYFEFVPLEDQVFEQEDLEPDSRLYRLLTTGNNMVPPR